MKDSRIYKKMILTIFSVFLVVTAVSTITSCKSSEVVIEDNMTAAQLIQRGQDAFQNGDDELALKYYQAVIDREEVTPANYVEARYEIGHLYLKRNNFKAAQPIFEEILELYRNTMPGVLPGAYKVLAEKGMEKIPETEQAKIAAKKKADAEALKQAEEEVESDEY